MKKILVSVLILSLCAISEMVSCIEAPKTKPTIPVASKVVKKTNTPQIPKSQKPTITQNSYSTAPITHSIWDDAELIENTPDTPSPSLALAENTKTGGDVIPVYKRFGLLSYLQFYTIKEGLDDNAHYDISMWFNYLTHEQYKKLNKENKKLYKTHKKYVEHLKRGELYYITSKDNNYIPVYIYLYDKAKNTKNYKDQLRYLNALISLNEEFDYEIFNTDLIEGDLITLNWINKNWNTTISYANKARQYYWDNYGKNEKEKSEYYHMLTLILADCYFSLGNYDKALEEALKVDKSFKDYDIFIPDILYGSYLAKNNYNEAFKITQYMIPKHYTAIWLGRAEETAPNENIKLSYIYKILDSDFSLEAKFISYQDLAVIKDKQIKNAVKTIPGYFVPPQWADIIKGRLKYISMAEEIQQHKIFYTKTDNCIKQYKGNSLKGCLADVKVNEERYTAELKENERYRQAQLLELERINQLQQMNANINYQNSLIRQQNYELSRPRYYNSTTTQYGNSYYTNTYSY